MNSEGGTFTFMSWDPGLGIVPISRVLAPNKVSCNPQVQLTSRRGAELRAGAGRHGAAVEALICEGTGFVVLAADWHSVRQTQEKLQWSQPFDGSAGYLLI